MKKILTLLSLCFVGLLMVSVASAVSNGCTDNSNCSPGDICIAGFCDSSAECTPGDTRDYGTGDCLEAQTCQEDGTWPNYGEEGKLCGIKTCLASGCGEILNLFYGGGSLPWQNNRFYWSSSGSVTCSAQGECISTCAYDDNVCADNILTDIFPYASCFAPCDQASDCAETDCDDLDGCYDGRLRDCDDVANDCNLNGDCACEDNVCEDPLDCKWAGTDKDTDGYDDECTDCNDDDDSVYPGADEVCDGQDNDCTAGGVDGQDESWYQESTDCGIGYCATFGVFDCIAGFKEDTCTPGSPLTSDDATCDAIDDDCDGSTDEDYPVDSTCGVGACLAGNTPSSCVAGFETLCQPGTPSPETCNNVDDDCDGSTDEDLIESTENQQGLCSGNTETCTLGQWYDDNGNYVPVAEICDGLDNDCDGLIDEDLTRLTSNQEGLCGQNTETCDAGSWYDDNDNYAPIDEICDNEDNDCDGTTDEDLTRPTTCGAGICSGNIGIETCSAGEYGADTCDPFSGAEDEICDGLDNDCDEDTDEDTGEGLTCTSIDLDAGWNLISIPLVPENDDTSVENVFSLLADDVEVVWAYTWDATTDRNVWTKHRITNGEFDDEAGLKNVVPGYGYYVYMGESDVLFLNGKKSMALNGTEDTFPVFGMPPSVTLAMDSWNLIGVYGSDDLSVGNALVSLEDQDNDKYYDIIYGADGNHPSSCHWWVPTELYSEEGYWLSVKKVFDNTNSIEYKANYNNEYF